MTYLYRLLNDVQQRREAVVASRRERHELFRSLIQRLR